MAEVTVRPLASADRPGWDRLWQGYLAFYRTKLTADVTDRTFERLVSGAEMHGMVATDADGRLVGLCHYLFHPATWAVGPYCYLEDLFVDREHRGRGVARALIEAVYRAADERQAARVYWLTEEDNETARRLYDRIGRYSGLVQYRR